MIFAELPGGIALRFQNSGQRHGLRGYANVRSCLAYRGQTSADRQLPGDEIRPTGCAACFGIVVGEPHSFGGESVEVRCLPRHDALVIGTDIEPTYVVTHDDEDIGSSLLLRGSWHAHHHQGGE